MYYHISISPFVRLDQYNKKGIIMLGAIRANLIRGTNSTEYRNSVTILDSFGKDLLEKAIKALRSAAKLDNKDLCKTLAAIAAGLRTDDMEVQ